MDPFLRVPKTDASLIIDLRGNKIKFWQFLEKAARYITELPEARRRNGPINSYSYAYANFQAGHSKLLAGSNSSFIFFQQSFYLDHSVLVYQPFKVELNFRCR